MAALEKKAEQIRILDLTKLDTVTDYFVICTGEVNQQVRAIASHIEKSARSELGERPIHTEGYDSLNWVLIDFVDVVVHVFRPVSREYYRLEDLWSDADVIDLTDDGEFVVSSVKGKAPKKAVKKTVKKAVKKKSAAKKTSGKKTVKKSAKKAKKKAPGTSVSRTRPKKTVKKTAKKTAKTPAKKSKAKKA